MRLEGNSVRKCGVRRTKNWSNTACLHCNQHLWITRTRLVSHHCSRDAPAVIGSTGSAPVPHACLMTSTRLRNNVRRANPGYSCT
jgi:hypothetical protein